MDATLGDVREILISQHFGSAAIVASDVDAGQFDQQAVRFKAAIGSVKRHSSLLFVLIPFLLSIYKTNHRIRVQWILEAALQKVNDSKDIGKIT